MPTPLQAPAAGGREPIYNVRVNHPPADRCLDPLDRLLDQVDRGLRTLFAQPRARRPNPARGSAGDELPEADRNRSAALMRVDHAGEVAAQGLYHGQALTARTPAMAASMHRAAEEEGDHLAWCRERLTELGGRPSRLDPVWYLGSLAIGAAAGLAGDRWSLGFMAETERQVEGHLAGHLARLPEHDFRSRAILEQMRVDEAEHAVHARTLGGQPLPALASKAMQRVARVMTWVSERV